MIPYGRQSISQADVDAVLEVLRSDFLTQGPTVPALEAKVARRVGAEFAVAVNSATSALHIACMALDVSLGDEVWTSPNSFVASANCALYCGAKIDFVDIDPDTFCICEKHLEEKLKQRSRTGGALPKVVITVHFGGQSCNAEEVYKLSKQYGFSIIEDASHALGGLFKGVPIGSCTYSDITIFSFHPVKIITTGEGGMALTRSKTLHERMGRLRTHGITRTSAVRGFVAAEGEWYYEQLELGFNYRMTDIQAALGMSQLDRLDSFLMKRRSLARAYDEKLTNLLVCQNVPAYTESARHLYPVMVDPKARKRIFDKLRSAGIGVNVHYIPIYWHPYYKALGFNRGYCPNSEVYYGRAISLPLFPELTGVHQSYIVDQLQQAIA